MKNTAQILRSLANAYIRPDNKFYAISLIKSVIESSNGNYTVQFKCDSLTRQNLLEVRLCVLQDGSLQQMQFWLMYPLLVACKSISKAAAQQVVDKVRQHSGVLVDQWRQVVRVTIVVSVVTLHGACDMGLSLDRTGLSQDHGMEAIENGTQERLGCSLRCSGEFVIVSLRHNNGRSMVILSYERAYSNMVRVQQLSELEEVIDYRTLPIGDRVAEERRARIHNMWTERIQGAKSNVEEVFEPRVEVAGSVGKIEICSYKKIAKQRLADFKRTEV
ncbi:hypothetical protein RJT34_05068 [Clitoria ternatea]|uniref:PIK-related kinase FAT domain-containing protein n=1 Tax=Clitoria ternatea TaxID=43366 RepID=A0AAN9K425_CLITE